MAKETRNALPPSLTRSLSERTDRQPSANLQKVSGSTDASDRTAESIVSEMLVMKRCAERFRSGLAEMASYLAEMDRYADEIKRHILAMEGHR
jgi:hypothetical protein